MIHRHLETGYLLRRSLRSKQDSQYTYKHNIQARLCYHSCRGKAISITFSKCVSLLFVIQHSVHKRLIIYSSVDCLLYHIFPHYVINGMIYRRKGTQQKMCTLIFSANLRETFLIQRRIPRDVIIKIHWSSFKVPVFLDRF